MKRPGDNLFSITVYIENTPTKFQATVEGKTTLKSIANKISKHMSFDPITTAYKFYLLRSRPIKKGCPKGQCKCLKGGREPLGQDNIWEIELIRTIREIWIERYGGGGFKGGKLKLICSIF